MMRQAYGIIDLQFGSTGKGLLAGVLAEKRLPDTICTAWGANAGHTYIDVNGNKFVHTMLANGIVSRNLKRILIGPGSIIDPVNLKAEIDANPLWLAGVDILIHPNAAIIDQRHRDLEAGPMTKIGSTKKGVGEAAIHRMRRNPDDMNTAAVHGVNVEKVSHPLLFSNGLGSFVCTIEEYNNALDRSRILQVEGAQGYSLSMYHGFYPYCTSRDVSTAQLFADCGIPWSLARGFESIGTVRTYPIRVANRYDKEGHQVGWSGPSYPDQQETSFAALDRVVELTTVTKLPRRIFTFSMQQYRDAVRQCGVDSVFVNFANYLKTPEAVVEFISLLNNDRDAGGARVRWVGMGPGHDDVLDLQAFGYSADYLRNWAEHMLRVDAERRSRDHES